MHIKVSSIFSSFNFCLQSRPPVAALIQLRISRSTCESLVTVSSHRFRFRNSFSLRNKWNVEVRNSSSFLFQTMRLVMKQHSLSIRCGPLFGNGNFHFVQKDSIKCPVNCLSLCERVDKEYPFRIPKYRSHYISSRWRLFGLFLTQNY